MQSKTIVNDASTQKSQKGPKQQNKSMTMFNVCLSHLQ